MEQMSEKNVEQNQKSTPYVTIIFDKAYFQQQQQTNPNESQVASLKEKPNRSVYDLIDKIVVKQLQLFESEHQALAAMALPKVQVPGLSRSSWTTCRCSATSSSLRCSRS